MENSIAMTGKERLISFSWQHVLLLISLWVMTLGVSLCVRSALGSSVISAIPYVMTQAGEWGKAPALTIGQYTYIMNGVLVLCQFLLLRKRFEAVQLFQLVIGFVFGWLLDANMALTGMLDYDSLWLQIAAQWAGCTIVAAGIAMEIRCGSVTMPGEGIAVALSRASSMPFAKAKIIADCTMVAVAVLLGYVYAGRWMWNVIGPGTLFAMIYVGVVVRRLNPVMGWFDRLVCYRPGFRRYVYGLARFIARR